MEDTDFNTLTVRLVATWANGNEAGDADITIAMYDTTDETL